jgi:hypothetical protein
MRQQDVNPSSPTSLQTPVETAESDKKYRDVWQEVEDDDFDRNDSSESDWETKKRRRTLGTLLKQQPEETKRRYQTLRKTKVDPSSVKALVRSVCGNQYSFKSHIPEIIATASKIFIGLLVEEAKKVMKEWRDDGPLLPAHIREAKRRLDRNKVLPGAKKKAQMFRPR